MVRRLPKPFTVEVRRSGRKSAASAAVVHDPALTSEPGDQPRVSWPDLDERIPPSIATEQGDILPSVTGRVLPVLNEPGPAQELPPPQRRRRRAPAPKPRSVKEPAFEQSAPASIVPVADDGAIKMAETEGNEAHVMMPDAKVVTALIPRQVKKRLPRSDFKRGQRWKARLPAAAHRRRR